MKFQEQNTKLQVKHPARVANHVQQHVEESITFELSLTRAITFLNGFWEGPRLSVPQLHKDLIAESNGLKDTEFPQQPTSVVNIILETRVPIAICCQPGHTGRRHRRIEDNKIRVFD